jgi:hypothetical protein
MGFFNNQVHRDFKRATKKKLCALCDLFTLRTLS